MSKEIIADSDYKSIDIHLINNYGANDTFWDNIGLFKETKGTSYQYDKLKTSPFFPEIAIL